MTLVDCKSVYTDAPGLRPEVSRRAKMSEVSECFNIDTGFLLFVLYFVPNIAGWYYLAYKQLHVYNQIRQRASPAGAGQ